jgi:predicted RNA-binding Zn-ribbon protein involved in translation (DUF1610 family)
MPVTNATLVMGDSGTGKSTLLATAAEWGWRVHKKVTLLYSTDTGGYPSKIDALIRAGIIRVWKLRTRGEAFETCSKACHGYWPVEFSDHVGGETPPGVALLPPIKTTYFLHCKCGEVVKESASRRAFQQTFTCKKCGTRTNLQTGTVSNESVVHEFFQDVGLRMYDGITSMNDWIMTDMAEKGARGEIKGEAAIRIVSGEEVYASSTRNHYGFAQTRSSNWINDAASVPGHVIGPIFTARKQRATDNQKVNIYGPMIAGQAKTSEVPAWVANCLGTSIFHDPKGRREYRLYLTEYMEQDDSVKHLCKTRAEPGTVPVYLSDGPTGEDNKPISGEAPFTTFSLGYFFDIVEKATEKSLEATLKAYPDAPGMKHVDVLKNSAVPEEDLPPEDPTPEPPKPAAKPIAKPAVGPKPKPKMPPKPAVRPQLKRPGPRPGKK